MKTQSVPIQARSSRLVPFSAPSRRLVKGPSSNAALSARYSYNFLLGTHLSPITVVASEVYLDGQFLCYCLRLECASEQRWEPLPPGSLFAKIQLFFEEGIPSPPVFIKLYQNSRNASHQAEIWETLEPHNGRGHDLKVQSLMGYGGPITRDRSLGKALNNLPQLKRVEITLMHKQEDTSFYALEDHPLSIHFERS
jgi:hypothetical protein